MRYVLAILETLLALGFFATAIYQLVSERPGAINLATDSIMVAIGLWLAKRAAANFKSKPGPGKA